MSGDDATAEAADLPLARAAADRAGLGPLRHLPATGSTNDDLVGEARAGSVDPAILVVDHQTAGRGRRDRRWHDTGAALLFSIRLPADQLDGTEVTVCLAAAARAAVDSVCPVAVSTKWPNDLVVEGGSAPGKLAGMLGELVTGPPGAAIVGLGLNLHPVPGQPGATSLLECGARVVERDRLLAEIIDGFTTRRGDPAAARAELRTHSATIGRAVRVDLGASSFVGTATEITSDGRLIVATETGDRVVTAADVVHLRSPGDTDADR